MGQGKKKDARMLLPCQTTTAVPTLPDMPPPEPEARPDRSVKGPPLASRSHTLQVMVMLTLNSFLLLLCLYVLPAHLLWRRALKQHSLATHGDGDTIPPVLSTIAFDAVSSANVHSTSATRNFLTAFQLLFSLPVKDTTAVGWIQRSFRSTLAAVVLCQGWFVARFKGWWDEAEAMERGDRDEVLKRRRIGIGKQMEVGVECGKKGWWKADKPPPRTECHPDNVCPAPADGCHLSWPGSLRCPCGSVRCDVHSRTAH